MLCYCVLLPSDSKYCYSQICLDYLPSSPKMTTDDYVRPDPAEYSIFYGSKIPVT